MSQSMTHILFSFSPSVCPFSNFLAPSLFDRAAALREAIFSIYSGKVYSHPSTSFLWPAPISNKNIIKDFFFIQKIFFNKVSSAIAEYQLSNFSDSSSLQLPKTSTSESFGSSTSSFKLTRP